MAASYDDWKSRGRGHLAEGRALDALSCFRQAARVRPRASAPLVGIADALWRLGRPHEAIATWRQVLERKPDHLGASMSLAEAGAFIGDDALAASSATRVVAGAPGESRAAFIVACARLGDPARRDAAYAELVRLVASAPALVRQPHLARMLARGLAVDAGDSAVLGRALAAMAADLPLALVAQVVADVALATLRERVERDLEGDDIDDWRLLARALAATHGDAGVAAPDPARADAGAASTRVTSPEWAAIAQRAADRYGALGAARFAAEIPLNWPRRAAGDRARIVVLVDADRLDVDGGRWRDLVHVLGAIAARAEFGFAVFGDAESLVARLRETPLVSARVTQMPAAPDLESARSLAAGDPDILLDAVGLARPLAPLLAARPARMALGFTPAPHLSPPLLDGPVSVHAAHLAARLGAAVDAALAMPRAASTPSQLQAALADAIEAHRGGRRADARVAYDAILADQPDHAPTLYLRGALRREEGDADAAVDFAAALAAAPGDVKARVALAQALLAQRRLDDARRVASGGPPHAAAPPALLRTLGHIALAAHDGAAAVNAFAAAIAAAPLDAETHFNHGVALQMLRYLRDAARAYQRALDLDPAMLDAHFNLGVVFDEMDETDPAIAALEYVITRAPARAEAHRALLNVLARHERGAQWMQAFERFERSCPDALGLVANALEYYQYKGDYARVHRYIDRLTRGEFTPANELDLVDSLEQLLYLMLFFDVAPGAQASLYATYDQAARHVYGAPIARGAVRAPGPLRIGYLSADFRDHVMGKMMLDVVAHHDRARFAVTLYSTAAGEDAVTAQFRSAADGFVPLGSLGDDDAVARIAADDLDLLVDLSTHTRGSRPAIVARKPARVAITHVASAGAIGLSAVDFKLTDHFADLPENDRHYVETLLPMAGCAYPVRRMTPAAQHPYQRAALGLRDEDVVIGAFVTPLKLSRRTTALWREILERLPRARLAFSPNADWLRDTYPAILAAAGIDPARAVMVPQGRGEAENLARYALVDFVLDPMPFGNVNGTIEPLNMGVPVVTLVGQTHGERTGYSILANLGETRTIATSGKDYVDVAVRLASDPAFMRDVRASLRTRMAATSIADPAVYARNLEAAYDAALAAHSALAKGDGGAS